MAVPVGVCDPWITADDLPGDMLGDLTEDDVNAVCLVASNILYVATNRYWPGTCTRLVRPDLGHRNLWWAPGPWSDGPTWSNIAWAGGWDLYGSYDPWQAWAGCDASQFTRFKLPGPVASVDSIYSNGALIASSAYVVDGRRTLVRVDGSPWPTGQDLTRDPTDPADTGTSSSPPAWQVTYQWGEAPPADAVLMCRSFVAELLAALTDCESCRLPWAGAVATVRKANGNTVDYASLHALFKGGEVGLADVDAWINFARGGAWRPFGGPRLGRARPRPSRTLRSWPA